MGKQRSCRLQLGNNDDIQVVVDQIIKTSEVPVVLDADGINAIAPFIDIVKDKKAPLIITPPIRAKWQGL